MIFAPDPRIVWCGFDSKVIHASMVNNRNRSANALSERLQILPYPPVQTLIVHGLRFIPCAYGQQPKRKKKAFRSAREPFMVGSEKAMDDLIIVRP